MNNDMKTFLRKLSIIPFVILCVTLCFFIFGIFFVGNQYQENYLGSILDKVARLKSINKPKIILIGPSSVRFGINSKMLQDAINMPVVNLGLSAPLGNKFHEDLAKFNINSGDLVIVCHHDFSDNGLIHSASYAWLTIEYHLDLWPLIEFKDYLNMLAAYPNYFGKSFIKRYLPSLNQEDQAHPYLRSSINEFGDVAIKPEDKRKAIDELFKPDSQEVPGINDICINRLNEYNKYIKSKGATLLIAGYPIGYGEFTPPAEEFDKFQHELESRLDCEVISNYRDYFIPYKYFYNTNLHLDNEGAKIRTQQLIKDIQRWQAKRQNKTGNL